MSNAAGDFSVGKKELTDKHLRIFNEMLENAVMSRQQFVKSIMDPRRNVDDDCGYPTGIINPILYQDLYDREPIPGRVVEVFPKECFQVQPSVYETEDPEVYTPFEEAWYKIGQSIAGEDSWYENEQGSLVWEYLRRVDILSGIGQYGVILLGLDDVQNDDLSQPVNVSRRPQLIFLRCFPESLAQITQFETSLSSRRHGQPTRYSITFGDPHEHHTGQGLVNVTRDVHWTRVIHIADVGHQAVTSEVFVPPRMRPVLNRLLDLRKLHGGSAEMYWRGAFPGISLETHPTLGAEVTMDPDEVRDQLENYMNSLQRYLAMTGITAKSLAPQVVDPRSHIDVQIEAICIKLGIPKRVFMGSERGELASSQDDSAWNDRLKERQNGYLTPRVIRPFVDRLIWLGVLPKPEKYCVWWPDLTSQSNAEKADIALKRTQALGQFANSGAREILPDTMYLTEIQGFTEEEAIEAMNKIKEERERRAREIDDIRAKESSIVASVRAPASEVSGSGGTLEVKDTGAKVISRNGRIVS